MKTHPLMTVARSLNNEIKRVAKAEKKTMEIVSRELATLTGRTVRQVYNWRAGNAELPTGLLPPLCLRFGSLALVDAVRDECGGIQMEVPESYELTRLVSGTIRDDLRHYEKFLDAFESDGIDGHELEQLRESGARIKQNVCQFEAIALADYERRRGIQAVKSNCHPSANPTASR